MRRATTIARRELTSYFYSPIAYVAIAVFLIACSFTFWDDFQPGEIAAIAGVISARRQWEGVPDRWVTPNRPRRAK